MSHKVKTLIPAIFLIITTVCLYTPHLIYFENRAHFSFLFVDLLPTLLIFTAVGLFLSLFLFLIPKRVLKFISPFLLVASLLIWLQASFFSISYGVLDDTSIDFELFDSRGYTEIFVILLVVTLSWLFRKRIIKIFPFILTLMFISQLGLVGYNSIMEPRDKEPMAKIDSEYFNYSTNKNVIVVVLDTFGAEYFQQIINNRPEILNEFDGFVSYTDAISNYPATKASIPSFLTGKMLKENQSYSAFLESAGKEGFLKKLESQGYKVSAVGMASRFSAIYPKRYIFSPSRKLSTIHKNTAKTLLDLSLFRSVPHFQKKYVYRNGEWLFSSINKVDEIPVTNPEKALYMFDMVTSRAQTKGDLLRAKFIHLRLPHPFHVLDPECNRRKKSENSKLSPPIQQSICTLNKLVAYLNKLKEIGAYDNSLIVVTSDHGSRAFNGNYDITGFPSYNELQSSGILFMIKGINQNKKFSQVNQPLSLQIIHDVLIDESNHKSELNKLEDSNRHFYSYQNGFNKVADRIHAGSLYEVLPNYTNPKSWNLLEFHTHNCPDKNIPLKITFTERHREEYCAKFKFLQPEADGSGVWTEGNDARILLKFGLNSIRDAESVTFEVTFSPSSKMNHNSSRIQWSINGQIVHEQVVKKADIQTSKFSVPVSLLESNKITEVKVFLPDSKNINYSRSKNKGVFIRQMKVF